MKIRIVRTVKATKSYKINWIIDEKTTLVREIVFESGMIYQNHFTKKETKRLMLGKRVSRTHVFWDTKKQKKVEKVKEIISLF